MAPTILAQIVDEKVVLSKMCKTFNNNNTTTTEEEGGGLGSADISLGAMVLMIQLILHWDHREVARHFTHTILPDGSTERADVKSSTAAMTLVPEVDGLPVCREAKATLS